MERVPQPSNTHEAPKVEKFLDPEVMVAGIEEAKELYGQLGAYDKKDFYGADAVVKKRKIDALGRSLAAVLRDTVPNEERHKNSLPDFPRYEGLPCAREKFPDRAPDWYEGLVGYTPKPSNSTPPIDAFKTAA
jgi:hypothetical protein